MSCEITFTKSGKIKIKTYPELFNEILSYNNGDVESSIDMYGMTLTDDFGRIFKDKKPSLDNLLSYINNDNIDEASSLTTRDRFEILNFSLKNLLHNDVKKSFIDAFTIDNRFGVNRLAILNSGIFTPSELDSLSDEELNNYSNLYYKLLNSEEDFTKLNYDIIEKDNNGDTINPDLTINRLINDYTDSEDILKTAYEKEDNFILNNQELIPLIKELIYNTKKVISYETDEYNGNVVKKEQNNIINTLEQSFDTSQNFSSILSQIEFIKDLPALDWINNIEIIEKYIENLEKQFIEIGLDFSNLSKIILDKKPAEIQDFLDVTYNFLYDIENKNIESIYETINEFSKIYNNFFNNEIIQTTTFMDNKKGVFLNIDTNRSESDLFQKHSVIKIENNIYQKIKDINSIEDLYNIILNNKLLSQISTIEDLENYLLSKASDIIRDGDDIETVKKIIAYKVILNVKEDNNEIPFVNYSDISKFDPENFIVDFNKTILKNEKLKEIFYISNRGIESKFEIGDYTNQLLKNILSDKQYNNLKKYAWVSQNDSLKGLISEEDILLKPTLSNLRDYYINNPNKLDQFKNDFRRINNTIISENISEPFIKIGNDVYEMIQPGVYEKLPSKERYLKTGYLKPKLSIDNLQDYIDIKSDVNLDIIDIKKNKIETEEIEFC